MFEKINSYYIQKVPKERILKRIGFLEWAFDNLMQGYEFEESELLNLNKAILTQVVKSYFYDVERLKHFHSISRIDGYKQAAFMIKWLVNFKPIRFTDENPNEVKAFHLCINEIYAIKVGLSMAYIPESKLTTTGMHKLVYNMYYRNFDEHTYTLLLESISK